jgi:N-acetylglucosaminyldiphosphoundecaprenol N-acetyl-beta-D-mannosaminyltransferase
MATGLCFTKRMSVTQKTTVSPDQILDPEDILLLDRREGQRTIAFLGVDFAPMDPETLFERVVEIADREDGFRYLVTPNVDQIVRLAQQPENAVLNQDAWANVNDSRIIEVLATNSGLRLPACPGSDLTARVLADAITTDETLVIIGGDQLVVDAIKLKYALTDVRWHQPPMGLRQNPEAISAAAQFCVSNPARFTFLCVGSPQQEMIARAIKQTGQAIGVGLCVGASLEFLTGMRKRAPGWMQQARLEWLFRLLSEPRALWRRYLVEGPKIFGLWLAWRKRAI